MSGQFRIDFQWLSREHGDPVERAMLAELAIVIDGLVATELEDLLAKAVRPTARVSAFALARWFVANWWRLRWEPEAFTSSWRMSHKIGASGDGYLWPDLTFSSDGSAVLVRARRTPTAAIDQVRYLNDFDIPIRAIDFESGIDEFIEAVLARLASEHLSDVDLAALWKEIGEERRTPDLAAWRKLEAMMGLDPDEAPDTLIESLRSEAGEWGSSAIEEIAASSKARALSDLALILDEVQRKSVSAYVNSISNVQQRIDREIDPLTYPWQRAVEAAKIAREVWSIGRGPVSTTTLSDLFEVPERYVQQPEDGANAPLAAALRSDEDGARIRIFLRKRHPASRRFALARLIGDHLTAARSERILPATEVKTDRQKFQRAFSQEFLCPLADLVEFFGSQINEPTDDAIEDASYHFQVSPLLIRTTLVNKGFLDREALGA